MRSLCALLLLLLATVAFAAKLTPEQMKARADSARGGDKAKHAIAYAHHCAVAAAQHYADGRYEEAHEQLQQLMQYGEMAANASLGSGKRVKQTEIGLRELLSRLTDLKRAVEFDEQAAVQQAMDSVETHRNQLIERLFGKPQASAENK